jgi:eukaryotic-like serine/threonine-protein kinase
MVDLYRPVEGEHMTLLHTCAFGERVVGTPGFMAPEQARGAVASFDDRTDVYGLGGILYYILYGAAPNQGHDIPEILGSAASHKSRRKFRAGILPRGQRVRPETREALEALEAICLKALEPEPAERHPTAEAMLVELNEWLAATPESPVGF